MRESGATADERGRHLAFVRRQRLAEQSRIHESQSVIDLAAKPGRLQSAARAVTMQMASPVAEAPLASRLRPQWRQRGAHSSGTRSLHPTALVQKAGCAGAGNWVNDMTESKDLKDRIRARQERTGESWSIARMHVLRERDNVLVKPARDPSASVKPEESPETRKVLNQMYEERWLDTAFLSEPSLPEPADVEKLFDQKAKELGLPAHVRAELKTHCWYLADQWIDMQMWVEDYSSESYKD
jgi:hypothetical protein